MRPIAIAALLGILAAQPPEPLRHDKYKDDPHAYCWNPATSGSMVSQRQKDPHAHRCDCHLKCQIGPDGSVIGDQEDNTCELYCTRSHCHCHVEDPCEMPPL